MAPTRAIGRVDGRSHDYFYAVGQEGGAGLEGLHHRPRFCMRKAAPSERFISSRASTRTCGRNFRRTNGALLSQPIRTRLPLACLIA